MTDAVTPRIVPYPERSGALRRVDGRVVLGVGLIVLGVATRLAKYIENSALWLDEAALVVNIIERPLAELFGPLDMHQNSPFGFLLAVKLLTLLFGTSEYVLRALPLAAGLAAIPLFYILLVRCAATSAGPRVRWDLVWVAMVFFLFSRHLIFFTSEVRHYTIDVALTCALYLLALRLARTCANPEKRLELGSFVALGALGAAGVWFSLASIFVLGGIGATLLFANLNRKRWRVSAWLVLLNVVWLLSFYLHLRLHNANLAARGALAPDMEFNLLRGFMPLPPQTFSDLKWFRETFEYVFFFPGGFAYRGLAGFVFLIGSIALLRRNASLWFMLHLPIAFALLASGLHKYPFLERFILFLAPCIYIAMAEGVGLIWSRRTVAARAVCVALVVLLLGQPAYRELNKMVHPYGRNEMTPLLEHVRANWADGDMIYCSWFENPSFRYYRERYGFAEGSYELEPMFGHIVETNYEYRAEYRRERLASLIAEHPRVWIFQGHYEIYPIAEETPGPEDALGHRIEERQEKGVTLYLYTKAEAAL